MAEPFKSAAPCLQGHEACRTLLQTLADSCWLQKASAGPRPFRRPCRPSRSFPPPSRIFHIFGRLFAYQKFIKNQTPQKTSQNLKNPTPERPKLDFEVILAPFCPPFSMPFRETSIFWEHAYSLGRSQILKVQTPQTFIKNPSKNHVFSRCLPGPHFSAFYVEFCGKMWFLDPFRNLLGSKTAPKIAQAAPKCRHF